MTLDPAQLLKFALADLGIAQRDSKRPDRNGVGEVAICKTKIGLIIATYTASTKTYKLLSEGQVLTEGKRGDVASYLKNFYVVIEG